MHRAPFQFTPLREGRRYFFANFGKRGKFQFTPLREGRRAVIRGVNSPHFISIHAPPRGATAPRSAISRRTRYFNSRPSARGDVHRRSSRKPSGDFNSRPSARGDLLLGEQVCGRQEDFNSRPSARGDKTEHDFGRESIRISIHAPPRGATFFFRFLDFLPDISIHAPPRGATSASMSDASCIVFQFTPLREGRLINNSTFETINEFQFTPLREGRPWCQAHGQGEEHISIHAPPRGATDVTSGDMPGSVVFQFTPLREGRRLARLPPRRDTSISIHAPPRGATHVGIVHPPLGRNFNSRPSARGDIHPGFSLHRPAHFNSRPSARGDANVPTILSLYQNFNSRPSARGDVMRTRSRRPTSFQFTPLREGRLQSVAAARKSCYFNSRPSARGDKSVENACRIARISIHAPPRGATGIG